MDPVRSPSPDAFFNRLSTLCTAIEQQWGPVETEVNAEADVKDRETRAPRTLKLIPEPVPSKDLSRANLYLPGGFMAWWYSLWYHDQNPLLRWFSRNIFKLNLPCQMSSEAMHLRVQEAVAGIFSEWEEFSKHNEQMFNWYYAYIKTNKDIFYPEQSAISNEYKETTEYKRYLQAKEWIEKWYKGTERFSRILQNPTYEKDITALFGQKTFDLRLHVKMVHCHAITEMSNLLNGRLHLHPLLHLLKPKGDVSNLGDGPRKELSELITSWSHASYPVTSIRQVQRTIHLGLKALVELETEFKSQDYERQLARLKAALSKVSCKDHIPTCAELILYKQDPEQVQFRAAFQSGSRILINGKEITLDAPFQRKEPPESDNFVVFTIANRDGAVREDAVAIVALNQFTLPIRFAQSCAQDEKEAKEQGNPLSRYVAAIQEIDHEGRVAIVERIYPMNPVNPAEQHNRKAIAEFLDFLVRSNRTVKQLEKQDLWGFNKDGRFCCMKTLVWDGLFNIVSFEQCAWNWGREAFTKIMEKIKNPLRTFFQKTVRDAFNGIGYTEGDIKAKVEHNEISDDMTATQVRELHTQAADLRRSFIELMKKEHAQVEDLEERVSKALSDAYDKMGYATIPSEARLKEIAKALFKVEFSKPKPSSPIKEAYDSSVRFLGRVLNAI